MITMDWLQQLFPLLSIIISGIFSIITLSVAIRQLRLSKKTQILRPHSDRLMEVSKKWLDAGEFLPSIIDIRYLREEHDIRGIYLKPQLSPDLISSISFVLQHLETGYSQIFLKLKELERQIEDYNKSVEEFINTLYSTIKNKIGLSESARNNRYAYYRRIISYTLRKILTGFPEIGPEIVERKPGYELRWSDSGLIIGNEEDCERGLKLISELQSSDSIIQKAKSLSDRAEELNAQRSRLHEMLYYNVVSKIQVGGIIQGKCDVCSR